ncbi:MAG: MFS transporter [Gammaproteobacteria bacterium]|nr:MFS transporter [Gammaproteobacteria bacterium]
MLSGNNQSAGRGRHATVYFFYYATLGALLPYWSLYLQHLEFDASEIGELSAVLLVTKIIAPTIWAYVADHSGQRMRVTRIAVFACMCVFALVLPAREYWTLLLVLACFGFFWNAALPQFEASTMNYLDGNRYLYGRVRLWGSIGFVVTVLALAPLLQGQGIRFLPWVVLVILSGIWLSSLRVQDPPGRASAGKHASLLATCLRPPVIALLLAAFLIQMSHGAYYTFFSIYLEEHGYSRTEVGQLWVLGVLAEIVLFLMVYKLLSRFGARRLLGMAMLLTAIRWWLIAMYAENLPVLLAAQLLHAASYGLFHASAICIVDKYFSGALQGRGMAIYSSISFGLGISLGSLVSGYTWNAVGASGVYLLSMVLAAIALLQYLWLGRPRWIRA